jgi:hypothetical protein
VQQWVRAGLLGLVPAIGFLALQARTLDYDLVWTDVPELVHGSILRPRGRILEAFAEPLHSVESYATQPFSQPYYRPLQVVTASTLDAHFGREPRVFRTATLALGALTAALFAGFAAALLRSLWGGLLAGCLFAAHPATLEIYVWTGGLAAAYVGACVVGSAGLALRALRADTPGAAVGFAAGSACVLAVGLLSKENAAVVPGLTLALALAALAEARSGAASRASPLRVGLALVAVQAVLVAAYLLVLRPAVLGASLTGAPPIGGSMAIQWLSSLAHWPADLAWLFVPWESNTSDAVRVVTSLADPWVWLGLALALGALVLFVAALARGAAAPAVALAWVWIAFLPTSGLAPLLHPRAERNLFLSSFGAALLWPWLGARLARRGAPTALLAVLAVALVGGLAQRTWSRQPAWRSTVTLFETDVARDPRHREGRLNLVAAYAEAGAWEQAKRHADVLVQQRQPLDWTSYALDASLLEAACRVNEAIGADRESIALVVPVVEPNVWGMPGFYACLAGALEREGQPARALTLYAQLHRGTPPAQAVPFALGAARCEARRGDAAAMRAWLEKIPPGLRGQPEIRHGILEVGRLLHRTSR